MIKYFLSSARLHSYLVKLNFEFSKPAMRFLPTSKVTSKMNFKTGGSINISGTEYESILLPRDVFFNKLSYVIIIYKGFSLTLAFEILFSAALICYNIRDRDAIILCTIFGLLIIASTAPIVYLSTRDVGLVKENELCFLKEVTVGKPGLDHKKWDSIASALNLVFYQNCKSATPYFFYDGEACSSCFRRRFVTPWASQKLIDTSGKQEENTSQMPEQNEIQVESRQGRYQSIFYNELDPFIEKAVNAYQESLEACWNELMNENSSVLQE